MANFPTIAVILSCTLEVCYGRLSTEYFVPQEAVLSLTLIFPDQFKPDVVLANWAFVHQLWHTELEDFEVFLEQLGEQLDGMTGQDGHRPRFVLHDAQLMCVMVTQRPGQADRFVGYFLLNMDDFVARLLLYMWQFIPRKTLHFVHRVVPSCMAYRIIAYHTIL